MAERISERMSEILGGSWWYRGWYAGNETPLRSRIGGAVSCWDSMVSDQGLEP
jgi:hypothetical protein